MLTVRVCGSAGLLEISLATKKYSSPEKSVEDDIISGATQTVCKHFFMLIASNTRANVKLIYTTCQEKKEVNQNTFLLWLH